jgi:deoxycytidine triphosphate deaminase
MVAWSGEKIAKYVSGDVKVNPNGVDLKVSEVWKIPDEGEALINKKIRELNVDKVKLEPDEEGFFNLEKGVYEVRVGHEISIPPANDSEKESGLFVVGLLLPRSTLNRFGIIKSEGAVWDSGYKGYGTQTIFVPIKKVRIHKDDFWFQLIFLNCESSGELYRGFYQGEKPK